MGLNKELDLSCFSYLATAKVLQIEKYPKPNYGAEVLGVIDTLVADGPIVAIAVSHLGLKAGFVGNRVGGDDEGKAILERFKRNKITAAVEVNPERKTPFIIVLSDKEGDREWFPYIPKALQDLKRVDLEILRKSSLVYIDFYQVIRPAAERAITFAHEWGIPIFINLGGSPFTSEMAESLQNKGVVIIQTNLDETASGDAKRLARQIFNSVKPEVSTITLGRKGAIAYTSSSYIHVPAYSVKALHFHGIGAAFSAGFALGYLNNWELGKSLRFACALGSMSCTVKNGFDRFSKEEVEQFIEDWKGKI